MVQKETRLKIADNTGAKILLMISNLASRKKVAKIGDIIVGTVKQAIPSGMIKKGEVVQAVVVRTVAPIKRNNGQTITFNENAAVIINKNKTPRGTRIFGPVAREIKNKGFDKIVSLVKEIL